MKTATLNELVTKYLASYDAATMDAIWQEHCDTFRRFWSERVMPRGTGPISESDCDDIIRILDRHGKGNTQDSQAVARVMVPQGAWRRMLNDIHTHQELASIIDSIFKEQALDVRASKIDELYRLNADNRNRLTGPSGAVVNALMAAYDPINNLTVVSLKDRKTQIDFLGLKVPFDWEKSSIGTRIVESNALLREGTRKLGIKGSARTLSWFWYFDTVKSLWRQEHTVNRVDKPVTVTVPGESEEDEGPEPEVSEKEEIRESLQIQAVLAEIGTKMGFNIWLPKSDRARVLTKWTPKPGELLDELPLGYNQTTMKTIEQIDVIWLKRRTITRAFEVEHTTSIYSGLLRMADLIALQPNLNIKMHIIAPSSRREKVLQEIRRPVFSLLEGRALSEICTYLSYDTVKELRDQKHLEHLSEHVLENYEERAGEGD